MDFLMGIDGGGSGCRAVLADGSGRVLAEATAGPANVSTDREGARANILLAARAALSKASTGARLEDLRVGLGIAGANAAGAADWLNEVLPFRRSRVETDAVTATLGALGPNDGIVAAIGTGSVFALRRDNEFRQIGGWGFVLGDEGSGAWLGRKVLARVLYAVDGRVDFTPFLNSILNRLGSAAAIVGFARNASPADFAAFAPEILSSDDPAARKIMRDATREVGAALRHLGASTDLPVTFIGGLGPAYARRLRHLPRKMPLGTSLDGALILARRA